MIINDHLYINVAFLSINVLITLQVYYLFIISLNIIYFI